MHFQKDDFSASSCPFCLVLIIHRAVQNMQASERRDRWPAMLQSTQTTTPPATDVGVSATGDTPAAARAAGLLPLPPPLSAFETPRSFVSRTAALPPLRCPRGTCCGFGRTDGAAGAPASPRRPWESPACLQLPACDVCPEICRHHCLSHPMLRPLPSVPRPMPPSLLLQITFGSGAGACFV